MSGQDRFQPGDLVTHAGTGNLGLLLELKAIHRGEPGTWFTVFWPNLATVFSGYCYNELRLVYSIARREDDL